MVRICEDLEKSLIAPHAATIFRREGSRSVKQPASKPFRLFDNALQLDKVLPVVPQVIDIEAFVPLLRKVLLQFNIAGGRNIVIFIKQFL